MAARLYIITFFVFLSAGLMAQQHPLFTQYMFNGLVINPAYTGSHESMALTASYRRQWTALEGAPETQTFSFHSPLGVTRSAAGMMFMHDKAGPVHQYNVFATYAYRIPVSAKGKLSVGAQAGGNFYNARFSELQIITPDGRPDPVFEGNDSRMLPNAGIGIYYYTKRSYIGISMPAIINNRWEKVDPLQQSRQRRHYLISAGHVFILSNTLKIKPNVLVRYQENGPIQYDINANLLVKERLWVGASYRMNDSFDTILELMLNDSFRLGYSYGMPTSRFSRYQAGSHEVTLNYRIRKNKHVVLSPRYF